jgi:hypothetical protein
MLDVYEQAHRKNPFPYHAVKGRLDCAVGKVATWAERIASKMMELNCDH